MKYIIVDCHGLAYRAFHTTGGLHDKKNNPTGTIYGFLGAIMSLETELDCSNFIFCFDRGKPKRVELCEKYKFKRHKRNKELTGREKRAYQGLQNQIKQLRKTILKEIGFKNVFSKKGYEADDIIASVCKRLGRHNAIIVSSDTDIFQLITKTISVYNPRTKFLWTKKRFKKAYKIKPKEWVQVKAIAGCGTDEVGGIKGVGEKSAIRFIRGKLKPGNHYWNLITCGDGVQARCKTIPLVCLPFEGTPQFKIRKREKIDWRAVLDKLKMRSLNKRLEYKER